MLVLIIKMTHKRYFKAVSLQIYDEQAKYLEALQELGLNMTQFVREAVDHYIPIYAEKLAVLSRYKKAMKNYNPNMNEDEND